MIRRSSAFAVLLTLGLCFTVEAKPPERQEKGEEKDSGGREGETSDYFKARYQWMVETWGEGGKIDPEKQLARVRSHYEDYKRDLRAGRIIQVAPDGPVQPGTFRFLGPANGAGRMTVVEPHPTDPQIVYAGGAGGGVWKSNDQGASWRPLTEGLGNLSVGAVALAPSDPNIVYFGTGEGGYAADFIPGIGIFKSTDAGETWQVPTSILATLVYRMLVSPTDPNLVLAFTNQGVQRSVNGGSSWARTSDTTWGDASEVAQVPNQPGTLHATFWTFGTAETARYAKSTDFGQTWTQKSISTLAVGTFGRTSVGCSADGQRVYLLLSGTRAASYEQVGLYRSTDGGETFARTFSTSPNILGQQGWYDNVLAVDPDNPDNVVLGGVQLYRSTNGGTSAARSGNHHVDHHHLIFKKYGAQKFVWNANDGGLWMSTNAGSSWTGRNSGLGTRQYYGIAIDPTRPNVIYGGQQDNGTNRRTDATTNFTDVLGGDGFECAINADNPTVVYGTGQFSTLYRSQSDGASWAYVARPFAGDPYSSTGGDSPKPFLAWVTLDPNDPRVVYTGTWRVWRSEDSGDNWAALESTGFSAASTTRGLAVAKGRPERLVAIQNNGIFLSNDRGASFSSISAGANAGLLKTIEIDPSNPDVFYVCGAGTSQTGFARVFRTTNAGQTWTRADAGLPAFAVEVVRVDPGDPNVLYAGTLVGLYRSVNAGASWERWGDGLPAVAIHDIQIPADGSRVVLGTHGRGIWQADAVSANRPPVVSIEEPASTITIPPGGAVEFRGTVSDPEGGATTRRWSFGDGRSSTAAAPPPVVYRTPGRYAVVLVGVDASGGRGAAYATVIVTAPNDSCANAIPLALVPDVPVVYTTGNSSAAVTDPADPATCSNPAIAHSLWFQFTAPANGTVDIDSLPSNGDTVLALYPGSCGSPGTALDCNDDAPEVSGGGSLLRTITVTAGSTYRLLAASWTDGGASGIEKIVVRVLFKPETPQNIGTTAVLPVVLDAFGRGGARFLSDLLLLNRSGSGMAVALTYGGSVTTAGRTASLYLAPGEQLRAEDALSELRREGLAVPPTTSTASQVGSLTALVTSGDANGLLLASRTASPNTNAAVGGSFGLFSQGTSYADAADAGPVYVYGLRQTERDRANVAFMHVRTPGVTDAITLEVEIFTAAGASAGTQSVTLAPTEWKQLNEILSGAGAGATTSDGGYVRVRRTAGNGRFVVYGVVNDQKTADGSLVPMARAGELTAASSVLVPIVLEAGGLGGSYYTSELVLANRSTKSGTAVLRYVGAPLFGGAGTGTVRVPLAAGSQKVLDGVLAYLRTNGLSIPTAGAQGGALFVTFEGFDATDDVYAGVRTGTPNPDAAQGGTFGVFSAGVPSAALATSSAIVPGLRLDTSARTNVAAVNAGDSPITLEIKLRSFEGYDAGQTLTRTLAPGEWYQWSNVFDLAGAGAGEGYAIITRTAGTSSWFAYGVLNDSATSDGSVVSMVR